MLNKNIYEIGLLINPDLSQQEAEKSIDNVKNIIEKNSASVISNGEVVDIDLAYQIITKIASKNERFEKAFFSWIKFSSEAENITSIKKEVDKIKQEVFRYLITKTVEDDEQTDKYKEISDIIEIDSNEEKDKKDSKVEEEIVDTTKEEEVEENKED